MKITKLFKLYAIIEQFIVSIGCHKHLLETVTERCSSVNLNQKTLKLHTCWVHWKSRCRLTVRKHALLWNNHEYQHSAIFLLKISLLTHFLAPFSFNTPWNTSENQRFPGIFRRHRKRPVGWNGLGVSENLSFRNHHWSSVL